MCINDHGARHVAYDVRVNLWRFIVASSMPTEVCYPRGLAPPPLQLAGVVWLFDHYT